MSPDQKPLLICRSIVNEPLHMRFDVLDSWRGLCAIMVALFHLDVISHVWGLPLVRNAYLFVDFFFVLSGFVISHAYSNGLSTPGAFAQFMMRRFGRVWPLHAALLAAFVAVEFAKLFASQALGIAAAEAAFAPLGRASLSHLPANLMLLHALGFDDRLTWNLPSWSISAEFWTYAVFGAATLVLGRFRLATLGILASLCLLLLVTHAKHGMDATFDLGFPRAILGFVIGHFMYVARRDFAGPLPSRLAALEWIAVIVGGLFVTLAGKSSVSFAAPFVFAAVVYVFSFEAGRISKALRYPLLRSLGLWSYSIYMVHDLVAYVLSLSISAVEKLGGGPLWRVSSFNGEVVRTADLGSQLAGDGLTILYLAIVVVLSAATYFLIEQPGRRAFNRIAGALASRHTPA